MRWKKDFISNTKHLLAVEGVDCEDLLVRVSSHKHSDFITNVYHNGLWIPLEIGDDLLFLFFNAIQESKIKRVPS
jgi:hypothetical protein